MTCIDLTLGPTSPIELSLSTTPIQLTSDPSPIELTVEPAPIELTVTTSPISLEITGVGAQGPPGAGAEFASTNKQGSSIAAGAPVATHSSGVGVVLADATTAAKPCVGLNTVAADDLGAVTVQTGGPYELDDWTAITGAATLAAKAVYFLGTTAGTLTTTSPTANPAISQRVGKAVSPTILDIDPWGFIQL